jgi:hypothetical protein
MKTLIKTSISFKPIELFKIILNRANHKIARKNIKINPQLAIFSFDHIGLSINLKTFLLPSCSIRASVKS